MKKKDVLELKKRLKKDSCTFTKMCGCYVNGEKHPILKFRETFLSLDEDEYFKYLDISKKVLSGTIGNNILELNFLESESLVNQKQVFLTELKNSQLKDDVILDELYSSIIASYDYTGNFLILIFHDFYDIITKTSDNIKIDESEEVYEYVLCAVCPVSLSSPGLRYFEDEKKIKARPRDWVVDAPTNGFVFPDFIDGSSDVNSIMYYTKNAKNTHPELMENVLGCYSRQTATIQKETFKSLIKDSFNGDEKKADKVFMEVQENLNNMIDEYNEIYDDTDCDPISLGDKDIQNLLIESGIPEEITTKIEKSYIENFGCDIPLAENLIDVKALKENEQRKREKYLLKQVDILQTKLEEVKEEATKESKTPIPKVTDNDILLEENSIDDLGGLQNSTLEEESSSTQSFDIVLQVKPEKVSQIKSQIIDGQKCIVIPINNNEQTTVNGLNDLI